jgi:hypothetical protein
VNLYTESQADTAIRLSRRGLFGLGAAMVAERVASNRAFGFLTPAAEPSEWMLLPVGQVGLLHGVGSTIRVTRPRPTAIGESERWI